MKKKTIIILSIIVLSVLVVGVCSYSCIHYFISSINSMGIVIEDMYTGNKEQITLGGMSSLPRYSSNGDFIYFINRNDSSGAGTQLIEYSTKERNFVRKINVPRDNVRFTASVFDNKVLCYVNSNAGEEVCAYALPNGPISKIIASKKASDALFSPDGKWISYIDEDAASSRSNLYIIPYSGGGKSRISDSSGMLNDVKIYAWTNDSKYLCYISFLTLFVKSTGGDTINRISLAGLNNFKSIVPYPGDPDKIIILARASDGGLSFSFYAASRKENTITLLQENRSFWEFHHSLSPDGTKIVYSSKSN